MSWIGTPIDGGIVVVTLGAIKNQAPRATASAASSSGEIAVYYHADAQGSVIAMSDGTGAVSSLQIWRLVPGMQG